MNEIRPGTREPSSRGRLIAGAAAAVLGLDLGIGGWDMLRRQDEQLATGFIQAELGKLVTCHYSVGDGGRLHITTSLDAKAESKHSTSYDSFFTDREVRGGTGIPERVELKRSDGQSEYLDVTSDGVNLVPTDWRDDTYYSHEVSLPLADATGVKSGLVKVLVTTSEATLYPNGLGAPSYNASPITDCQPLVY